MSKADTEYQREKKKKKKHGAANISHLTKIKPTKCFTYLEKEQFCNLIIRHYLQHLCAVYTILFVLTLLFSENEGNGTSTFLNTYQISV